VNTNKTESGSSPGDARKPPAPEGAFALKECSILVMPTGRSAVNLRELHQGILEVDEEVIEHHLFRCHLKPSYERSIFPNDFAIWCARALGDFALAEKLATFDPYVPDSITDIRQVLADTIDDHLCAREPHVPWAKEGFSFFFERSVILILDSGLWARTPSELAKLLYEVDVSSIYYHFFDARRRHSDGRDDFSRWLDETHEDGNLRRRIAGLDFHLLSLEEVRGEMIEILSRGTAAP